MVEACHTRGVPFEVVDVDDAEIAALYERKLVLVRPDGHVAWRGDRLPTDATALIDRVRGALAAHAVRNPAAAKVGMAVGGQAKSA